MCGRFEQFDAVVGLAANLGISISGEIQARYNVAPTQSATLIRNRAGNGVELAFLRWGLVPGWAQEFPQEAKLINARSETLADKPSFCNAFRYRRCIIPADGFYEWRQTEDHKRPYYIRRHDQSPLALAGLWEAWRHGDQSIESFTIITVEANTELKALHQRMPAILEESNLSLWLDPAVTNPERIQSLLQPDHGEFEWYPVSTVVNNPGNEGPTLILEAPLAGGSC